MNPVQENMKHAVDAVSVGTVAGALMGYLPAIAALFTIIWTAIRIWETKTVQDHWLCVKSRLNKWRGR